ncbi:alpha amylase catalytic region (plasmid) [Gemmatirosa kalamazoonensis]|uniref:Alpha amylase catalytic region n=1 Tax=Gemmatirosa kalamazoonensis TaxID=861299 RepID=W0RS44_9BACT|nr:alpha-amylase family glycosyl hydrolase [Gemmatirosa kalamazoonensis]AHG93794.1 alpha amylase catalytic region [Gemmatirosa kalamazoonensis]
MKRARLCGLAASLLSAAAAAQPPVVEKVDPPNWWAAHSINPVRLLIKGRNLAGARVECPRLACGATRVNAAGTYAFVDVTIPRARTAGDYPLVLRTPAGTARVPFTVSAPLARAGRFAGFGHDDVIYLIMPDRFADGDPSNDDPAASRGLLNRAEGRRYHGGDLAGVRAKLPYLKDLGVTAIWLNPIYDNTNVLDTKEVYDGKATTAYHGYHAIDYYAVDEHFGDVAEFKRLVDAAHAQGIKVILDMVANHTSAYHPWVADPPTPTWYHGTAARHPNNTWQTWTLADPYATPDMRRATLDGWFIDILPDLNQDDPDVARYITQNTLWWVGVSGIDGIRQDTWPYVPRTFWRDWMTAINREYPALRVVGEVFDGDPAMIAFFQGGRPQFDGVDDKVQSLFDFPLYYAVRSAFASGRPVRDVAQLLSHDRMYRDPSSLVTFLGLHDVSRFMNERGATTEGLELAYTFLLTARGTPLLYYGDEIALPGGNDPDNRRDFPGGWPDDSANAFERAGRSAGQQAVWAHVQKLLRLRAARPDLRRGPTQHLFASEQQYVYRRGSSVVALNNDTKSVEIRLPLPSLPGDALGLCPAPRAEGGGVVITVPRRTGCVF